MPAPLTRTLTGRPRGLGREREHDRRPPRSSGRPPPRPPRPRPPAARRRARGPARWSPVTTTACPAAASARAQARPIPVSEGGPVRPRWSRSRYPLRFRSPPGASAPVPPGAHGRRQAPSTRPSGSTEVTASTGTGAYTWGTALAALEVLLDHLHAEQVGVDASTTSPPVQSAYTTYATRSTWWAYEQWTYPTSASEAPRVETVVGPGALRLRPGVGVGEVQQVRHGPSMLPPPPARTLPWAPGIATGPVWLDLAVTSAPPTAARPRHYPRRVAPGSAPPNWWAGTGSTPVANRWTWTRCAGRSCCSTSGLSAASTACTSWTNCARSRTVLRRPGRRGVHSPKFEHEADPVALAAAVERYEVHHPVLDDPELDTWKAYTARAWPTLVVIDPEGYVVAHLSGEGHAPGLGRAHRTDRRARGQGHAAPRLRPVRRRRPPTTPLRFPGKVLPLRHDDGTDHAAGHRLRPSPARRAGRRRRDRRWGPSAPASAAWSTAARPRPASPSRRASRCSRPTSRPGWATTSWSPTPSTTRCAGCAWPTGTWSPSPAPASSCGGGPAAARRSASR